MGLQADEAVDDVSAGLLQLAGPDDVRLLIEAGLDLDEHDDLLPALGRPDEIADDRRVARCPVERHLDREDFGVLDGLPDESLDGRREALVGVMDQHVTRADNGEHIGRLVLVGRDEARRDDRRPCRALEVQAIKVGDDPEARQIEHPPDLVAVLLAEANAAQQDLARRGGHRPLDLEADRLAKASPT